jgi:hypothetical protein
MMFSAASQLIARRRFLRRGAVVGGKHDIVELEQPSMRLRLILEHVEPGAAQPT